MLVNGVNPVMDVLAARSPILMGKSVSGVLFGYANGLTISRIGFINSSHRKQFSSCLSV